MNTPLTPETAAPAPPALANGHANVPDETVRMIGVDLELYPSPANPRKHFDDSKLRELADSILQHGIVEPLVVRRGRGASYEIVAGERRWRAARMMAVENLQRVDLTPIEEARAFRTWLVGAGDDKAKDGERGDRAASDMMIEAIAASRMDLLRDVLAMLRLKAGKTRQESMAVLRQAWKNTADPKAGTVVALAYFIASKHYFMTWGRDAGSAVGLAKKLGLPKPPGEGRMPRLGVTRAMTQQATPAKKKAARKGGAK